MRATAVAHPMQALVKYHGLKDWELRIPYHDSISVNVEALNTTTTIEFGDFEQDVIIVDGRRLEGRAFERALKVIDFIRKLSGVAGKVKVESRNSIPTGRVKGVGFSSSAGAALAVAAYKATGLDKELGWDLTLLSRIARRLAGSACRSVVGEYARWYAGGDDVSSYAERIASKEDLDISMVLVPLYLDITTEQAHAEAEKSAFFKARVESAQRRCDELEGIIKEGDFTAFGRLVELDSLELHAVTMTGVEGMLLVNCDSLKIISLVRRMRKEEGVDCFFSMQTGPSVFINTTREDSKYVVEQVKELGYEPIVSGIGGEAFVIQ